MTVIVRIGLRMIEIVGKGGLFLGELIQVGFLESELSRGKVIGGRESSSGKGNEKVCFGSFLCLG